MALARMTAPPRPREIRKPRTLISKPSHEREFVRRRSGCSLCSFLSSPLRGREAGRPRSYEHWESAREAE
jgi:hypothetical protein